MRLISVVGPNAVVRDSASANTFRIQLEKLDLVNAPPTARPTAEPPKVITVCESKPKPKKESPVIKTASHHVLYRSDTKQFWTADKTWERGIDNILIYPATSVTRASARMTGAVGRYKGVPIKSMTIDEAREMMDEPAPAPEAKLTVIEAPKPEPKVLTTQVVPSPPPPKELATLFDALARTIRNEAAAMAMHHNAIAERVAAEAEMTIAMKRRELGF